MTRASLLNCGEFVSNISRRKKFPRSSFICGVIAKGAGWTVLKDVFISQQHATCAVVAKIKLLSVFYDGYSVICRICHKNIDSERVCHQHLSLCCLQFVNVLPLLPSPFTIKFDEPIGMCSRLIILNLTRVSSGTTGCMPLLVFTADFYLFRWHAAGNENSDRNCLDDSAKKVF